MKIIKQRYLRGPNLYTSGPCLLTVIDLKGLAAASTHTLPGFADRLIALVPTLEQHGGSSRRPGGFGARLRDGTNLASVLERVTIELQALAGHAVSFGRTHCVAGHPGQYRVVCAYQSERVAGEAFALALQLVGALARGELFELDGPLEQLHDIAAGAAIGTSTAAVLAAAQRRGIPSQRIAEGANLFQLGWGSKQKRLQATITGATSHVAVGIASDKQLTKALLRQAGLPVPEGETVTTPEQACRVAARLRAPVTASRPSRSWSSSKTRTRRAAPATRTS